MMDALRFIFSSFWTWLGTMLLVGVVINAIGRAFVGVILVLRGTWRP